MQGLRGIVLGIIDYERFERLRKKVEEITMELDGFIQEINNMKAELNEKLSDMLATLGVDVEPEKLREFLEEPYLLLPKGRDRYYVIVPRWIRFYVGWLEHQTRSYNVFVINRYMRWITDIPREILKKMWWRDEDRPYYVVDGYLYTGDKYLDEAWKRYRKYLVRREGDKIRIKRNYEFQLIAELIEDGILPFTINPVDKADLRPWNGIQLRDYQREAWRKFLKYGAIGVYWSFGSGKSIFGLYALARVKGRKLVVVPANTLKEQWVERINRYIPEYAGEIEVITYHSYHKVRDKEYVLTVFDEAQHLPSNTFIRLSTIKTKYRIGLSGSPFREDGRESYIFALTGYPVGMDWRKLIDLGIVKVPLFKVYILKSQREKLRVLGDLLRIPVKTIIFCDYIDLGKKISRQFNIPFVYGDTKNRLEKIRENEVVVVSRVGDEGLSIPDIERVIEVAFLGGSRMQESQRFGRLMHSQKDEPEHIILMTEKEFERFEKRLYAITQRGFRIQFIR